MAEVCLLVILALDSFFDRCLNTTITPYVGYWDKMLKVVHGGLNYLQSRSGSLMAGDLSRWGILPISVILQTEIGIWLAVG